MKLLNWVRTKKKNSLVPSKDFKGGLCCLRAEISSDAQDIRTNSFSFSFPGQSQNPNPLEFKEELRFDEDGFNGFLAIGTLGRDPETPKFAASSAEEDKTRTQKEMANLITKELDKFLEEHPNDTIIKPVERLNAQGDVFPLQSYDHFRSSIEIGNEVNKKKGLLARLFKERQIIQGGESSYMERHATRDLIKSIFKKLHGSPSKKRFDDDNDDDDDSMHKKKEHRKNVQIFGSKVHPVLYGPASDDNKVDGRRSCINVPSRTGGLLGSRLNSESNKKRENWIMTDAEYLVLEL